MVDAVITWVDGADPGHRQKRQLYAKSENALNIEAHAATRFSDNGELHYCIQLIRKNAPWINRIFLVTDAQCPEWLDKGKIAELGVQLVDHKVIFRGHEEVLPTFSSRTIETCLHRIPELSERFVFLNDDFFITRPVTEADYFEGDVPLIRGFSFYRNKILREITRMVKGKTFTAAGMIGTKISPDDPLKLVRDVKIAHTPHPINRYDFASVMEASGRLERNIPFRTRDQSQFRPLVLYAAAGLKFGRIKLVPRDDIFIDPKDCEPLVFETLKAQIAAQDTRHMCVQSLDNFTPESRASIFAILDQLVAS